MFSPTQDIEVQTAQFYDEYDGKILDVIDSESQEKYLKFLEEYVVLFPTFQESAYLAIFRSDPALYDRYTDYQLSGLKEGAKALEAVEKSKDYHKKHKLKGTAYSRYYDEMVIKPKLAQSGMTKEACYQFRFQQDPELNGRYRDYKLEEIIPGAAPKAFVETCREAYKADSHTISFAEFYYKEFYEYDYLYRHDQMLFAQYTDCTFMTLRDGAEESEAVKEAKERIKAEYDKEAPQKSFWCYFCKKYYGPLMERLPARELAAKNLHAFLATYRKTDIWKKQGYLLQSTQTAESVRNIAFHLAIALGLEVSALQDLLQKGLLQAAFNPKSPTEAIYWYCLQNRIPYADMLHQYLEYMESDDFHKAYRVNIREDGGQSPDTQYWGDKLNDVLGKSKEEFYKYLWWLKYSLQEDTRMHSSRKTPSEVFWEYFYSFPKTVWTGTCKEAKNVISPEELYDIWLKKTYKREDWMKYAKNKEMSSFDLSYDEVKKFAEANLPNDEYIAKYSDREKNDFLESEHVKHLRNIGDIQETAKRHSGITEYESLLPFILEKSQQNYYAEKMYALLPVQTLGCILGDLKFTKKTVQNWRTGITPLSRNELIATVFISTSSDFFINHSEKFNPRKDRWEQFEAEVNAMLEDCGFGTFYERNPFELFIRLCFLYPEPLGYFLASFEKYRVEKPKKKQNSEQ